MLSYVCFAIQIIIMIILPVGVVLNIQLAGNARTKNESNKIMRDFRTCAIILIILLIITSIIKFTL
jgi:uncharacterized BrkB/YihY/UPF0761 family membrane protein